MNSEERLLNKSSIYRKLKVDDDKEAKEYPSLMKKINNRSAIKKALNKAKKNV